MKNQSIKADARGMARKTYNKRGKEHFLTEEKHGKKKPFGICK